LLILNRPRSFRKVLRAVHASAGPISSFIWVRRVFDWVEIAWADPLS